MNRRLLAPGTSRGFLRPVSYPRPPHPTVLARGYRTSRPPSNDDRDPTGTAPTLRNDVDQQVTPDSHRVEHVAEDGGEVETTPIPLVLRDTCQRCGRRVWSRRSIARLFGACCWTLHPAELAHAAQQHLARVA